MKTMWIYLNLIDGRLLDDNGYEIDCSWPSFNSWNDAEQYLEKNDIRASLR